MNDVKSPKQQREEAKYKQIVKRLTPKSDMGRGLLRAFCVGGLICMVGQGVRDVGQYALNFGEQMTGVFTAIVMIFLGGLLTGIGVYDKLGKIAGAGSIVPITGFANSIVSAAMEFKREGFVFGLGAKMFQIAGPVLVYGIGSSVIVGIIAFFVGG